MTCRQYACMFKRTTADEGCFRPQAAIPAGWVGRLLMTVTNAHRWPENRGFHRYRTQPPVTVIVTAKMPSKGVCRDIGIGGACVILSDHLQIGEVARLTIKLPDFQEPMQIPAVVRNRSGNRYGFEFLELHDHDRERIEAFGRDSTISAYLFTPNATIVRSAQQVLQDMGVSQVWRGSPDSLPVPNPHIVIVDSEWPDFVDVAQLLRSESADNRIIVVALVGRDVSSKAVKDMGADIVLHKPLPRNWVERLLGTAVKLLGAQQGKGEKSRDIVWSN